jgi:hypothetical protein
MQTYPFGGEKKHGIFYSVCTGLNYEARNNTTQNGQTQNSKLKTHNS